MSYSLLFSQQRQSQQQNGQRRGLAVLGIGEGWTGAMVPGQLDQRIRGHFDEAEVDIPVVMYDKGPVLAAQPGWGHTALIVPSRDGGSADNELLLTGRPFDFPNLLRLRRMPGWIRRYANRQHVKGRQTSLNPSIWAGYALSWLVKYYQKDSPEDRALLRDWDAAEAYTMLDQWTSLPTPESPISLGCSAGFSAFGTQSGSVYTFGLNTFGQCGVGLQRRFGSGMSTELAIINDDDHVVANKPVPADEAILSRMIWTPEPVVHTVTYTNGEEEIEAEEVLSFDSFALGLQHGIGLTTDGKVFCWGKGERGQLGQHYTSSQSPHALAVHTGYKLADIPSGHQKPLYCEIGRVVQIASGMLHSAALTVDNEVFIWGKYVIPPLRNDAKEGKTASDSKLPCLLEGLPHNKKVIQIACGSHHTAILLEDGSVYGVGISTDSKEPMHDPMELIPPGVVDMPVRQFAAHMDRTTVVGADGQQVLQVHIWKDPSYQEYALFTPDWVDRLLEEDSRVRIKQVHRGWLHTVIVSDD